ncbi:MAG: hypothetical protein K6G56_07395 [Clostridiales bacterium]|nr:hypothetical protein [Clostridiales bacterium]
MASTIESNKFLSIARMALCIFLAAVLSLASACVPNEKTEAKRLAANVESLLDIKLKGALPTDREDFRDFQGWGHFYSEFDMASRPLDLAGNANWRELPPDAEFAAFFSGEESVFGRSITAPGKGYWFFRNYMGDRTRAFKLTEGSDTWYYCAAFYDTETDTLTVWYRSR